jgi:hypothetical protein
MVISTARVKPVELLLLPLLLLVLLLEVEVEVAELTSMTYLQPLDGVNREAVVLEVEVEVEVEVVPVVLQDPAMSYKYL